MSYQKHNFTPGAVLLASQLNDMDNEIETLSQGGSGGTVLSDDFKEALLNCFENVAWINENGQTYYDALYDSLYPDNMWFITNVLTGCATSNNATSILKNNSYVATITANEGYTLDGATVSISMGGNDVTNLYYSSGSINIPNVTGNLVITVSAVSNVSYITATFDQGEDIIYDTDSLDVLNQYLIVRAFYDNSESVIVDYTEYELSGTLTAGTSTITVSYSGKTDTFNVTVTLDRVGRFGTFTDGYTAVKVTNSPQYPSYVPFCHRQATANRATHLTPVENKNYIFTVTDASKYNIAIYDVSSMTELQIPNTNSANPKIGYSAGAKTIAWASSDSASTPYIWIALKKMNNTAFTAAELANAAEAVFTFTESA